MNTEAINTDLLWQRMQEDWQAARPTIDASALVRQINRRRRFMIGCLAVDLVAAVAVTGLFGWKVFTGSGTEATLLAIILAIILAILWLSLAVGIWDRRGTWRADGADTRSLLRLMERRARASIRRAWRGLIGSWLVIAVVLRWNWHQWLHDPQASLGSMLAMAAVIVLGSIWTFWNRRRQQRKLQRTRALLEQLSREDENP